MLKIPLWFASETLRFCCVAGNESNRSHQLIRKVRILLKYGDTPYMLVIHCWRNDIGQILKPVAYWPPIKSKIGFCQTR